MRMTTTRWAILGSVALCAVTFAIDLALPLGVAAAVPYVLAVVLALWVEWPLHAVATAGVATVLTIVAWLVKTESLAPVWVVTANRLLALLAVWVTAAGVAIQHDTARRLRQQEALLRQQEALVRLGEMSAVIAHEVRNPLTGIAGALQVIGNRLPPESPERRVTADCIARIGALHQSLQELLVFARPRAPSSARVPLRPLLRQTVDLLSRDARTGAVEIDVSGADAVVRGDADLLKEAFLNILLNAAQAMGGTGTIRVDVADACQLWRLSFTDQGPGIPTDIRERVFEPFFTTKTRGTGLGLPIVKRTVELHGGRVELVCPPEGGTTVIVDLPQPTD